MKKLRRSVVYLLLLTSVLSTTALAYRWHHSVRCKIGDMTASLAPSPVKELESVLGAWVRNAQVCRVGEFLIAIPVEGGSSNQVSLVRKGGGVLIVDGQLTTVFDQTGKRVQFQSRRGQKARANSGLETAGWSLSPVTASPEPWSTDNSCLWRTLALSSRPKADRAECRRTANNNAMEPTARCLTIMAVAPAR